LTIPVKDIDLHLKVYSNIMNPEFLRQTVKKLLWLSDYIISEKDSTSDNYWENHMKFIFGRVQKIIELLEEAKNLKNTEVLTSELYVDPWLMRQQNVAYLLSTDPFVPTQIRERVASFYLKRVAEMSTIYIQVMTRFCKDIYNGKLRDINMELKVQAWGRLGDAYVTKGWGLERTEEGIIKMRGEIEAYLTNLK